MGRARVPQAHHRLGTGAVLRDHLSRHRCHDGSENRSARSMARLRRARRSPSAAEIDARSSARANAQRAWRSVPHRRARRDLHALLRCVRSAARRDRARAHLADGPADPLRAERGARHARARASHDRDRAEALADIDAGPKDGLHALRAPRAARRRVHGRRVELPVSHRREQRRAGAHGRQRRRAEALRADAAVCRALRRVLAARPVCPTACSRSCT